MRRIEAAFTCAERTSDLSVLLCWYANLQGSLEMQQTKRVAVEQEMELRSANAKLASIVETHRVELDVLAKDYQAQIDSLNADLEETKERLLQVRTKVRKGSLI